MNAQVGLHKVFCLWLKSNVKSFVTLAVSLENISMDLNNMMPAGQGFQQQVNQVKPSLKMTISVNPKKQKKKERKKKKKKHRKRVESDDEDEDSDSDSDENSGEDPDYS